MKRVTPTRRADGASRRDRGQSNVVGIAILLGVTVLALGTLTASVGVVVQHNAASADATRVAADLQGAIQPVRTTGLTRGTVSVTDGRLRTEAREVRVLNGSGTVAVVRANALVFDAGHRGVTFLGGAIVRRGRGTNHLYHEPPISASRDAGVLVVGVAAIRGSMNVGGTGGVERTLSARVTHDRRPLGNGRYRVAVETRTPKVWERYFQRQNATVLARRDFDGDGLPSVVVRYPGRRTGYLVVHNVTLEGHRG